MNIVLSKAGACIIAVLAAMSAAAQGRDAEAYAGEYRDGCREALSFYQARAEDFRQIEARAGLPAPFLFAIAAPEISQYGIIMDRAQTYSLKVLYVQLGEHYANFSIGWLQMKPSFAEFLEQCAINDPALLSDFPEIPIAAENGRSERSQRVTRLESLEWQLVYLALFCRVVAVRHDGMTFDDDIRKLRFYANAYNAGVQLDSATLDSDMPPYFPHFSRRKFRYSEISVWFYQNLLQKNIF